MSRLVFLLEEQSMKTLLEGLLPRCFPGLDFLCISHEGKQDLEKSIPRKLRAWREPGVRFVVVHDNDGGDCMELKRRLMKLCADAGREDTLIRIAMQELEAWYFGDANALAKAFEDEHLGTVGSKRKYRDPDSIVKPSAELAKLAPAFQKVSGARKMAKHLDWEKNTAQSFQVFMSGLRKLRRDMGAEK